MLGILGLRLTGYYKIKQGIINKTSGNTIVLSQQKFYMSNLTNYKHVKGRKGRNKG